MESSFNIGSGKVVPGFKYDNLNQARIYCPILTKGDGNVAIRYLDWDCKGMGRAIYGNFEQLKDKNYDNIFDCYYEIGTIDSPNLGFIDDNTILLWLEKVYRAMQGENWNPHAEASELIENLGKKLDITPKTSMSVGDIILVKASEEQYKSKTDRYFIVANTGFEEIVENKDGSLKAVKFLQE
tara:strand:+ start:329 stop:877 length:549 start_codon:yes stop_codon:yes gene_type:complete